LNAEFLQLEQKNTFKIEVGTVQQSKIINQPLFQFPLMAFHQN